MALQLGRYFIKIHDHPIHTPLCFINHNNTFFVSNMIESSLSRNTVALAYSSSFSYPVDITVYHNGFHGDLNETFYVGEVDEEAKKLVQTTYECLMQAIDSGRNSSFVFFHFTDVLCTQNTAQSGRLQ